MQVRIRELTSEGLLADFDKGDHEWWISGKVVVSPARRLTLHTLTMAPTARETRWAGDGPSPFPPADKDPWAPHGGVTSDLLRSISIPDLKKEVWTAIQAESGFREWEASVEPSATAEEREHSIRVSRFVADDVKTAGRPKIDDEQLRDFALRCIDVVEQFPKAPIRRLAQLERRPEPTVKYWIAQARQRGYLAKAQSGVPLMPGPRLHPEGDSNDIQD